MSSIPDYIILFLFDFVLLHQNVALKQPRIDFRLRFLAKNENGPSNRRSGKVIFSNKQIM